MSAKNTLATADVWFWPRVLVRSPEDCWLWQGTVHHLGYGKVKVEGRQWSAHRVSFVLSYGQPSQWVLHKCGVPLCCNPSHLYDGDAKQNASDRISHGNQSRALGEKNPQSKLTEDQVRHIRSQDLKSVTRSELADMYGVTVTTISKVRTGKRWASVSGATAGYKKKES